MLRSDAVLLAVEVRRLDPEGDRQVQERTISRRRERSVGSIVTDPF